MRRSHKVLVEGQSIRQTAREIGISRKTVKRYLVEAAQVRVEQAARGRPVLEKVGPRIDALLGDFPRWTAASSG